MVLEEFDEFQTLMQINRVGGTKSPINVANLKLSGS
jgi:hypothetical protein